ncbi:AraC family transcriptional regulator ligand-binding domain-containing protein [Novosphingobium sp. BL-8H]|uniref:AraC family transcriptional regulator n=1 Tax=Novosphingobium sp. BL-8H TaxID=3127640 RepID=UPI0037568A6E
MGDTHATVPFGSRPPGITQGAGIVAQAKLQHAPSPHFHVLRARLLRDFPALVRDLGGCPYAMLKDAGLTPDDCNREGAASYEQWIWLMQRAAQDLSVVDFGMRLAVRQHGDGVYGKLGTAMRNSRTFGEATSHAVTHNSAHSLAARVWKEATASGRHVFLGHDVLVEAMPNRCQAIEQLLLLGHLGAMAITGGKVRAREIHFRHHNLAPIRTYRRYFGCAVRFCCTEDGIAFRSEDMACPILDPDAETLAQVIAQIRKTCTGLRPSVSALVRGMVMQRLWTSECGSEDVARLLAMHPRTLHRRLRDEGSSFQRIKDEVRCDYMLYYLERTDLELGTISHKLGFSEQSALSHFARNMMDASPRDLRARAGRGGALAQGGT